MRTLSKPAGLPVFPPHDHPGGDCVLARLLAEEPRRAEVAWPRGFDGGIAHRLDTSTSGALAVADDPTELAQLRALFASKALHKTYRFLAARDVPWDTNRCARPLGHDPRHRRRMVVQRGPSTPVRGRWYAAETAFERIRGTLWQATMRSGVMHQVRVHAAFVGLPLLGDRKYGGGPTPPDAPVGLEFFLHETGFVGPDGVATDPVALPAWAT